jgi:hypothetical protein
MVDTEGREIDQVTLGDPCGSRHTRLVQVLYAYEEVATARTGEEPRQQRRPQVAHMELRCRRRCEPAGHGVSSGRGGAGERVPPMQD